MGVLDRLEEEFLEISSHRRTLRELLELVVGSVLFVLVASGLAYYLLGRVTAIGVAAILAIIFTITIVSQAYWAMSGRKDYDDGQ
ncbi:hypothetical protein [Natrialba swarupiae]|uniref:Uncharacterized protein n=1 Tax=Natrialba swarupiae TaxID=2448032 RepID=A0A5D5AI03_9EURY|nr:hypothetical protein [Natrialba swarupiae]MCW8172846.1 hypothetical protein [Natrialba swarupiae]TYT60635.1 hypothetical protein FYC77_17690 [Natrialba swarupiae]